MLSHEDAPQYEDDLRAAGLRVTAPRLATLAVVEEHHHADADLVVSEVRRRLGSVSKQAIYDGLGALSDASLLRKVNVDGRRTRYELNRHDNHHHFACRRCGRLEDVPCAVGSAPCIVPSDVPFSVEGADVVYRGLCAACLRAEATPEAIASP
ncbi:Fur family transcriptional regulator [Nigerium massiliense]|uniref:Fur family transcriptional regulator n=1 Tax=Nigerium massiliense TaxID=1522317 RepID=UPI00058B014A|nr:Fur family transcriptional regulator [Nigerium massiliense]